MRVAMLCPGPSLLSTWDDLGFHMTIGLNRVPTAFKVDVWAAMDWPLVVKYCDSVVGNPMLLTTRTANNSLARKGKEFTQTLVFESIKEKYPLQEGPTYTIVMAIAGAVCLGAKSIWLFGNDRTDEPDWDGHENGNDKRNEARWIKEGKLMNELCRVYRERGIRINRVGIA